MTPEREKEIREIVLHCARGYSRHPYKFDVEVGLELLAEVDRQKGIIRTQVGRLTTDGLAALRVIDRMNAERDTLLGELKKARDAYVKLEQRLADLLSYEIAHRSWCDVFIEPKGQHGCDCGLAELLAGSADG